jgi:hypothetical protein
MRAARRSLRRAALCQPDATNRFLRGSQGKWGWQRFVQLPECKTPAGQMLIHFRNPERQHLATARGMPFGALSQRRNSGIEVGGLAAAILDIL